jgi:two-component system, NarL family, response regulator NreC
MISIVIVDDHSLVREGLVSLLKGKADLQIVGEAPNGRVALQLIQKLKPSIVLMDLVMPELHGLEVIRKIGKGTKVIAVSMRADELYVAEALKYGAVGYILKEATGAELVDAIHAVAAGKRYLSKGLDVGAVEDLMKRMKRGETDPYESLTLREQLVLQLSAEGLTSAEIAEKLFISARTAETHRANLMRKLALRSQSHLVRFAIRKNVVTA